MPRLTFPFTDFPLSGTRSNLKGAIARRPILLAEVTASNGNKIRCRVCLDTGADNCVFPLALAVALQIDVLTLPQQLTGGVGTTSNVTYFDRVSINLGSGIVFGAVVGCTAGMDMHGLGLLGQEGFFSVYDVCFSHRSRTFTIDRP